MQHPSCSMISASQSSTTRSLSPKKPSKPSARKSFSFLRASRKGWEENFKDTTVYPPKFADSWFKGTGRSIENELFFNNAQKPLIEAESGIYSMSEEAIEANIKALAEVGIKAKREYFDTSLLEEI